MKENPSRSLPGIPMVLVSGKLAAKRVAEMGR